MAQAVECLLCKCEVLSSNSSPTKKKKERERKKQNSSHMGLAIEMWAALKNEEAANGISGVKGISGRNHIART
jgi:hypothetical protein